MFDALSIIEGLSPEQVLERAKACQLEVAYWQHIIADCSTVNGAVHVGVTALLDATAAALTLVPMLEPAQLPIASTIIEQVRVAMGSLKEVVDALDGTLELADGRRKALEPVKAALLRAAGVELGDDDAGGEQ